MSLIQNQPIDENTIWRSQQSELFNVAAKEYYFMIDKRIIDFQGIFSNEFNEPIYTFILFKCWIDILSNNYSCMFSGGFGGFPFGGMSDEGDSPDQPKK